MNIQFILNISEFQLIEYIRLKEVTSYMSTEPIKNYIEDEENDFEEIMDEPEEVMEEDDSEENPIIDDETEGDAPNDEEDTEMQ